MMRDDDAIWMLGQLEQLALRLGVEVRYERLGENDEALTLKSGYCRLREQQLIIVDSALGPEGRCQVLATALGRFDLSKVFVSPAVRALVSG